MAKEERNPGVRKPSRCRDVYEFLEQVRLRPGMWVPGGSLRHLQAMLIGYRVALDVHAVAERFDLWPSGPFTDWLATRYGMSRSLGWAGAIEYHAAPDGAPLEVFFTLLDEYRAEQTLSEGGHDSTG